MFVGAHGSWEGEQGDRGPGCGPAWEMLPPAAHSALSRDEGEVQLPKASFRSNRYKSIRD